jgi:hypothetical protein
MSDHSAYKAAEAIPVLVVHDNQDYEVPVKAEFIFTNIFLKANYAYRSVGALKILGDENIEK